MDSIKQKYQSVREEGIRNKAQSIRGDGFRNKAVSPWTLASNVLSGPLLAH